MNIEETLSTLLEELPGCFEAYHVTHFQCHRRNKSGETEEVRVEIYDAGFTAKENLRYYCRAISESGKSAGGNPDSTIEMALIHLHWADLDK